MADAYVQVQFENSKRFYNYIDGTGSLQPGDQVPLDPDNGDDRIVTVVSQARTWPGELKTITSKPIKVDSTP